MPRPTPRLLTRSLVVAVLAGAFAACGSDGGDAACGPILRESLDSAYLVHVLGDDTGAEYTSDPPTSGPHQPGPPVDGVVEAAISRPIQVGILERGDILLQHDPDLPAAQLTDLESLAGEGVVVAPNPDLDDPVVATAWTYKRTCRAVDTDALRQFIEERAGRGPDN